MQYFESRGVYYKFDKDDDLTVREAWFVAKNNSIEFARIWSATQVYKCSYDVSITEALNNMKPITIKRG